MKKYLLVLAGITVALCFYGAVGRAIAGGTIFGRAYNVGYLTGQPLKGYDWLFVPSPRVQYDGLGNRCNIDQCTVTLHSFLKTFHDRLTDPTSVVDQGRAASVIDIMLNQPGTNFGTVQSGINYADAHYAQWESLVESYASGTTPGYSVHWNDNVNFGDPYFKKNGIGMANFTNGDIYDCTHGQQCIGDIVFTDYNDNVYNHAVVFTYPGGAFYIKHKCGNLTGDTQGLPVPPPPVPLSCGLLLSNAYIDPFTSFSLTPQFTFQSTTEADAVQTAGYKIVLRVYASTPGNTYSYGPVDLWPPPPQSNVLTATTPNIGPTGEVGAFTTTFSLVSPSGGSIDSCNRTLTITNLPYFNVLGGDVSVGAGMVETACPTSGQSCNVAPDSNASIVSWNQGAAGNYAGAGVQYAAQALKYIQAFSTAQETTAHSTTPSTLSLANSNISTLPSGVFGGMIGSEPLVPDYFDNHPYNTTQSPGTITNIPTGKNTIYVQGNEVIDLSGALGDVPNGSDTTIYVNGNVTINSDIRFTNTYNNVASIPSFTIITKGNIYIKPTVGEIDGVYVAEPDVNPVNKVATNGVIYTCTTTPMATIPSDPNLTTDLQAYYSACNHHLDIYGSFIARQVTLLRTYGSLYQKPYAPAETFHYTPEVWLSPPLGMKSTFYNAITGLPPVL